MAEAVSVARGVEALHDELERSRDRLRGVDENIKKLTGRDPSENRYKCILNQPCWYDTKYRCRGNFFPP